MYPSTLDYNSKPLSDREKLKKLWKSPGSGFAKFTGAAAIGALLLVLYKALPFLITLASNLIFLIIECVVLIGLLYVITNKEFRRGMSLFWLQIMRKMYGLIVNIDPINILRNGINEMKAKLKVVHDNVTKLESLLVGMKRKMAEYKEEFGHLVDQNTIIEQKLQNERDPQQISKLNKTLLLNKNKIVRYNQQIQSQEQRIKNSEKYLEIMKKLEDAADFKVKNAEDELRYRKDEFEQARAQQKAMSSISAILKGGLSRSMEEEIAMDQVTTTINDSIAEMNRLLDGSNDILTNYELDRDANALKADEILRKFNQNGFSIFETPGNPALESGRIETGIFTRPRDVEYEEVKAQQIESPKSKYFGA